MQFKLLLLLLCCFGPVSASAAQYIEHGIYRIHYTTFSSLIIPPDVASAHDIVRSEKRVVLNLSVLKQDEPAAAAVSGQVINLLNQRFDLIFDEINEAEAIYYLASHLALEHDILRFNLVVKLNEIKSVPINFVRRYD